jgi:hypothetical protein
MHGCASVEGGGSPPHAHTTHQSGRPHGTTSRRHTAPADTVHASAALIPGVRARNRRALGRRCANLVALLPDYKSSSSSGKGTDCAADNSSSYWVAVAASMVTSGGLRAGDSTKFKLGSPTSLRANHRNGFSNW